MDSSQFSPKLILIEYSDLANQVKDLKRQLQAERRKAEKLQERLQEFLLCPFFFGSYIFLAQVAGVGRGGQHQCLLRTDHTWVRRRSSRPGQILHILVVSDVGPGRGSRTDVIVVPPSLFNPKSSWGSRNRIKYQDGSREGERNVRKGQPGNNHLIDTPRTHRY